GRRGGDMKAPKRCESKKLRCDWERLEMLHGTNHRHPFLVWTRAMLLILLITLDMALMLECGPHTR
ncbi:MAG: hypothetical protein EBS84_18175, partial [Proteobacteria bacterium]|nr:hypothetical protein [Pseudomonadota bacterium]